MTVLNSFPSNLLGLLPNTVKRPIFSTRGPLAARSGKEQAAANWPFPKWEFELSFEFLRENVNTEYQTLLGFFLSCQGKFGRFYFQDPDDNTVADQVIGTGDGATEVFRLIRVIGSQFTDLIYYADTITNVYLDGVPQPTGWAASASGQYGNDSVTFASPPGSGVVITADFTFKFVCRFLEDQYDFGRLWQSFWELKKIDFTTVF